MKQIIKYRSGYKYQLAEPYKIKCSFKPLYDIWTAHISFNIRGVLVIYAGYAWDGPSGPVRDRKETMRGSLVHDALYQLMRGDKLNTRMYRKKADELFRDMCIEDGVSKARAWIYYKALRTWGGYAADPRNKKKIRRAP